MKWHHLCIHLKYKNTIKRRIKKYIFSIIKCRNKSIWILSMNLRYQAKNFFSFSGKYELWNPIIRIKSKAKWNLQKILWENCHMYSLWYLLWSVTKKSCPCKERRSITHKFVLALLFVGSNYKILDSPINTRFLCKKLFEELEKM